MFTACFLNDTVDKAFHQLSRGFFFLLPFVAHVVGVVRFFFFVVVHCVWPRAIIHRSWSACTPPTAHEVKVHARRYTTATAVTSGGIGSQITGGVWQSAHTHTHTLHFVQIGNMYIPFRREIAGSNLANHHTDTHTRMNAAPFHADRACL